MSTFPSVHVTDSEDRDIFDSLESCEKLMTAREVARILPSAKRPSTATYPAISYRTIKSRPTFGSERGMLPRG